MNNKEKVIWNLVESFEQGKLEKKELNDALGVGVINNWLYNRLSNKY